MKLAIHKEPGSYSDRWIPFCESNGITYIIVDCFAPDIIERLKTVDCLMWHWHLADRGSLRFAKGLTAAIEQMGVKVFPSGDTAWHYDDKVAQKYLFEALQLPLIPSYVFYSKEKAVEWVNQTSFPKVFKLRGGAGSVNVSLANSRKEALRLVSKAFGSGFPVLNRKAILGDRLRHIQKQRSIGSIFKFMGSLARCFVPSMKERLSPRQVGYIYFQDFIPNNKHDTRLVVIGNRCIGLRRYCRGNDFRASGSGDFSYEREFFPDVVVSLAFECARKLKMQSVAFDFVERDGEFLLVEVSYCFSIGAAYDDCPGYWARDLEWINAPVDPQRFILEDLLETFASKSLALDTSGQ